MGFKLGRSKGLEVNKGEIKNKLSFKRDDASTPGTPIIRKPLEDGILGEANMDGSIYLSDQIIPGSEEEREVLTHEMRHATDIKLGKLKYGDNYVKFNGITYPRQEINGIDAIMVDGEWKEAGSGDFPWEVDANNGNHGDTQ